MSDVDRVGVASAWLVTVWVALFGVGMVLGVLGIDSHGLPFFSALLLAPSFVALMAAVHGRTVPEKRIWSGLGVAFAIIYAMLVTIVYYVQLVVVLRDAPVPALRPFTYTGGTVFFAVDMLGYGFMCLSTWVAAPAFPGRDRLSVWTRGFLIFHGLLIFGTLISPAFIKDDPSAPHSIVPYLVLLFWCAVFIPLTQLVARHFRHPSGGRYTAVESGRTTMMG